MKRAVITLVIIALIASGCGQTIKKQQTENKQIIETEEDLHEKTEENDETGSKVNSFILKNLTIDEDYFRQKINQSKGTHSQELDAFINQMFSDEESTENLQIIDTVAVSETLKLLLVGADNENENWAWIALFDNKNHVFFSEQVYYQDYVEYFYSISTKIKDNIIQISTSTAQYDDCYSSQETEIKGHIVKNNNLVGIDIDTIPPF